MTECEPAPPAAPLPDLLRTSDLTARFGCCERTIRRWCAAGHLVPLPVGRSVFFRSDDIRRLIVTDMAADIVKRATTRGQHGSDPHNEGYPHNNDPLSVAGDLAND